MRPYRSALVLIAVTLAFTVTPAGQQPEQQTLPLKLSAFAVSLGGQRSAAGTAQVDITINRWSTDGDRERLLTALKNGQDALLDTLRDLKPVGSIRTAQSLAYDLHYAHQAAEDDGGRRLFLATDRPIGFWEATNRPESINYPFTFIEIHLNGSGEGEGKLSIATRVNASRDGKYVELENYAAQPVMLNSVKLRR